MTDTRCRGRASTVSGAVAEPEQRTPSRVSPPTTEADYNSQAVWTGAVASALVHFHSWTSESRRSEGLVLAKAVLLMDDWEQPELADRWLERLRDFIERDAEIGRLLAPGGLATNLRYLHHSEAGSDRLAAENDESPPERSRDSAGTANLIHS